MMPNGLSLGVYSIDRFDDDDDQKILDILGWWKNFNESFSQSLFLRLEVFKHNFLPQVHRDFNRLLVIYITIKPQKNAQL